jgi:hypothetical protein
VYGFNSIGEIQQKFLKKQEIGTIQSSSKIFELKFETDEENLKCIQIENVQTKQLIIQISNNTKTIKNIWAEWFKKVLNQREAKRKRLQTLGSLGEIPEPRIYEKADIQDNSKANIFDYETMQHKIMGKMVYKHINHRPKINIFKFSEIEEYQQHHSLVDKKVNTNYFVAAKNKKLVDDKNTIEFNLQRNLMKSSNFNSEKSSKKNSGHIKALQGFKLSKNNVGLTSSKSIGKAIFRTRKRNSLTEARIRSLNFKKRVKSYVESYPNKGITDKSFIK